MKYLLPIFLIIAILIQSCIPQGRDYGKELYEDNCSNCHGIEGDGLQQLNPPLKGSDYLIEHQNELACLIRFGINEPMLVNGENFSEPMPGKPLLTDIEVYNIINYISKNINSELKPVRIDEVNEQLLNCNRF